MKWGGFHSQDGEKGRAPRAVMPLSALSGFVVYGEDRFRLRYSRELQRNDRPATTSVASLNQAAAALDDRTGDGQA